jgi:hypothetical protein
METITHGIGWALSILAAAFFGGFLHAYMAKMGENRAAKDSLKDAVKQLKIFTETAEGIKTELSEATWSKQRHWDMKRDAALNVMNIFGEMEQILNNIFHIRNPETMAKASANETMKQEHINAYKVALEDYLAAIRKLWQARQNVALVFSEEVSKGMDEVQNALAQLAALLGDDSPSGPKAKALQREALRKEQKSVTQLLRRELGVHIAKN